MGDIAVQMPTCVDSQGCFLDPIKIKQSSAAKMRLADKTGNIALRKEAAAEQSFADRLGGRTALLSDELKLQILKQKELAGLLPSLNAQGEKVVGEENNGETPSPTTAAAKQPKRKNKQSPTQQTLSVQLPSSSSMPPEAIMLKLDAATKQSIADKTGNLALKRTAALEQSLADKMAYASSSTSGPNGVTTAALHSGRKGFVLDGSVFTPQSTTQVVNVRQLQKQAPAQSPSTSPSTESTPRSLPIVQPTPQPNSQPKYRPPALRNQVVSPPQQHQVSPPQQHASSQPQVSPPQQLKWNAPNQPTQPTLQQSMDKRKQRLLQRQQQQQKVQPTSTSPTPTPRASTPPLSNAKLSPKQELKVEPVIHSLAPATAAM